MPARSLMRAAHNAFASIGGAAAGLAFAVQWYDHPDRLTNDRPLTVLGRCLFGIVAGALVALVLNWRTPRLLGRLFSDEREPAPAQASFHAMSFAIFLAWGGAAIFWRFSHGVFVLAILAFAAVNVAGAILLTAPAARARFLASKTWLAFLFFLSGMAALIYQVSWQRSMFTSFGINIESVTVVVTVFMAGLGLGALLGGWLSRRAPERLPAFFLAFEMIIGLFGLVSLPLIRATGAAAAHAGTAAVTAAIFALLLPPTVMMGATLPVLVEYLHAAWRHVGRVVGLLYFVNTLGSACACYLAADLFFVLTGQQGAVLFAAACNITVGVLVYQYTRRAAGSRGPFGAGTVCGKEPGDGTDGSTLLPSDVAGEEAAR